LVKYFVIEPYEFQDIMGFLDKYGMQNVLSCASHFNNAKFLLNKKEKSFIVFKYPKKSSVQMFSELLNEEEIVVFQKDSALIHIGREYSS
jgi:hypothetical protein